MSGKQASPLHALLRHVCSDDLWHSVVQPAIADMHHEQQCVASRVRVWLVFVAACWGLFKAVLFYGLTSTARDARSAFSGLATLFLVALSIIITFVLVFPQFYNLSPLRRVPGVAHLLVVYLIPQALSVALPVAMFLAVVLHVVVPPDRGMRLLRAVLPPAFAIGLASLVLTQWIGPSSNQAFRQLIYSQLRPDSAPDQIPPGLTERGWSDLRTIAADPTHSQVRQARTVLRMRYVLSAVTLFAGLLAIPFGLGTRRLFGRARGLFSAG